MSPVISSNSFTRLFLIVTPLDPPPIVIIFFVIKTDIGRGSFPLIISNILISVKFPRSNR